MLSNAILLTWDRPLPGREQLGTQLFQDTLQYMGALKSAGTIESFDPLFLEPRGVGIAGLILIRGEPHKLVELTQQDEWTKLMLRAQMTLKNPALLRGFMGAVIGERMKIWSELTPR
jgi:hypothetical protein